MNECNRFSHSSQSNETRLSDHLDSNITKQKSDQIQSENFLEQNLSSTFIILTKICQRNAETVCKDLFGSYEDKSKRRTVSRISGARCSQEKDLKLPTNCRSATCLHRSAWNSVISVPLTYYLGGSYKSALFSDTHTLFLGIIILNSKCRLLVFELIL